MLWAEDAQRLAPREPLLRLPPHVATRRDLAEAQRHLADPGPAPRPAEEEPPRAILDTQSVQTTEQGGPRGKDPHQRVNGRKRHLVVATRGLVVAAVVHAADLQDRDGAKLVLAKRGGRFPRLKKVLADGISHGGMAEWAREVGGWIRELVVRPEGQKKFKVLPWRWIVERTFAWLGRYRRLSKDSERCPESSESWIYIAMIHLMLRRLEPV